ncbi:MAG TPA: hypothetical protein VMT70_20400 [Vicinamibacteria bacterium]|nr:hypothetical protein [Vicinamibacteria bacterium]
MAKRQGFSPSAGEPQADVPRWTSGRECWVFRAETPDELCGHHPRLISSALRPGELFHYLLYSPVFDAKGGPFRVVGVPGSHAVAITRDALLVSRDLHTNEPGWSVARIALDAVSCVEIGCALALGWFVVRYAGSDGPASYPVLFRSRGTEHFRAIVRAYRRLGYEGPVEGKARLDWPTVWEETPTYVRTELEPLVEETERPLAVLRTPEHWTVEKRWWGHRPVCTSAPGLLVATSLGLLWAASEPRRTPAGLSFGVNVTVVRRERVRGVAIGSRESLGVLRLKAGGKEAAHDLEVPFDGEEMASAEEIVHLARAWGVRV